MRLLEKVSTVAWATLLSRLLGLLRDVLLFASLGTSALNSAFLFAFTVPNLFRRLLGEGALSSALVPIFSEDLASAGRQRLFNSLNRVLFRLVFILVAIIPIGTAIYLWIASLEGMEPRWLLGARFGVALLPYVLFVCVGAILGTALNILGRFAVPALSQVWLNLSMIAALGLVGPLLVDTGPGLTWILCGGVLVGGIFQVGIPLWALRSEGYSMRMKGPASERMKAVRDLFLPGLVGAAIMQVNILVSRLLALWISAEAVSILYLANRLIELPLGIFAIAVTTVSFPDLSRHAAQDDMVGFSRSYQFAKRLILAITMPAAAGLIILAEPILHLLFSWGAFGRGDVAMTVPILVIFALGLPFYAWAAYTTRGFHALKDMRTPLRLAFLNFLFNIVLSLWLMQSLGMIGLAVANVGGIVVHCLLLERLLYATHPEIAEGRKFFGLALLKIGAATTLMAAMVLIAQWGLQSLIPVSQPKLMSGILVIALIPAAIGSYVVLLRLLRSGEATTVASLLFRSFPLGTGTKE